MWLSNQVAGKALPSMHAYKAWLSPRPQTLPASFSAQLVLAGLRPLQVRASFRSCQFQVCCHAAKRCSCAHVCTHGGHAQQERKGGWGWPSCQAVMELSACWTAAPSEPSLIYIARLRDCCLPALQPCQLCGRTLLDSVAQAWLLPRAGSQILRQRERGRQSVPRPNPVLLEMGLVLAGPRPLQVCPPFFSPLLASKRWSGERVVLDMHSRARFFLQGPPSAAVLMRPPARPVLSARARDGPHF